MSLSKCLLLRLNSSLPLNERCEIARLVCTSAIGYSCKEDLVVNWLCQQLEKEPPESTFIIWDTLFSLLEQANRRNVGAGSSSLMLKNSFAQIVQQYIKELSTNAKNTSLIEKITGCVYLVLLSKSTSTIFRSQPEILLTVLASALEFLSSYAHNKEVIRKTTYYVTETIRTVKVHEMLPMEQVIRVLINECLESIIRFIDAMKDQENADLKLISNITRDWLKITLCHSNLNQSYKTAFNLEYDINQKPVQKFMNNIEVLIKTIETWLHCDDFKLKEAAATLVSLLLQGFSESQNRNSRDLSFSIITFFVNNKNSVSLEDLVIVSKLLVAFAKNPMNFQQNGNIPQSIKLQWFRETTKVILSSKMYPTPAFLKCCTSLLTISAEVVEPEIENLWKVCWLNRNITVESPEQAELFCTLMRVYVRLRQVPKLFMKLTTAIKEQISERNPEHSIRNLPSTFLVQFRESVASLPVGQTLELWQILLNCGKYLLEENTSDAKDPQNLLTVIELLSALLIHVKLADTEVPVIKMKEVKLLMQETVQVIRHLKNRQDSHFEFLSLCFAWGEVCITMKFYQESPQNISGSPAIESLGNSALFDLSMLHDYLSVKEWTSGLGQVQSSLEEKVHHLLVLLLIQKARYSLIAPNLFSEGTCVINSVASYLLTYICEENELSHPKIQISTGLWESIVLWLPILVPALGSKKLFNLCNFMTETLLEEDACNLQPKHLITRIFMKSDFFLESRFLQTTMLTCIWAKTDNVLRCTKRKIGESDVQMKDLVLRSLSKHPRTWHKLSDSRPEDLGDQTNVWSRLNDVSTFFVLHCQQNVNNVVGAVKVDEALKLIQFLFLFPLENVQPQNQIRCIFGLLQILSLLRGTIHEKRPELHVLLCQGLLGLLDNVPATRMAMFFEPNVLLQEILTIAKYSLSAEEQKWSLKLLDRIVYIFIYEGSTLEKVKSFSKQLNDMNGSRLLEIQFLHIVIRRLVSLLNRYAAINQLERFKFCDNLAKSLVTVLSKKITCYTDLDQNTVWQSIICILSYHCQSVSSSMESVKRKPQRVLKQHQQAIHSLLSFSPALDCKSNTKQIFYQLTALICENRTLLAAQLPENFILKIWHIYLEDLKSTSHKSEESIIKTHSSSLSSVLKCFDTPELELALNELSMQSKQIIESYEISSLVSLWTAIINTDFGNETHKNISTNIGRFLKRLMPLLFQPLRDQEYVSNTVLPILNFVSHVLTNNKQLFVHHAHVLLCLQACSGLRLSTLELSIFLPLCKILLTVYQRLLTRTSQVILQAVAPFLSCLSVMFRQIISHGNQVHFQHYSESTRNSVILCAQDFSKLLGLVANSKTEFSKQAGFIIAVYLSEVQSVTVHTLVKEQLLLGVYKLMDICDEHVVNMLQVSVSAAGREILKQLHQEFNQHYRYKGKV